MPDLLDIVSNPKQWTPVAQGQYTRMFSSIEHWTLEKYTGPLMLICSLSSCGLLIVSVNPMIHEHFLAIRDMILADKAISAMVRFEGCLYLIDTRSNNRYSITITTNQLNQFDQILLVSKRKKDTLYRFIMTEIAPILPFFPDNRQALFNVPDVSACSAAVKKWNVLNPRWTAMAINDFSWIAPCIKKPKENIEQTETRYLSLYIPTELCKKESLTPDILPFLHFFRRTGYTISANSLYLLTFITQFKFNDIEILLTEDSLLKIAEEHYTTPVMYYALTRSDTILRTVMEKNPELGCKEILNAVNAFGLTVLMQAVKQQREDIVEYLLARDVSLDPRDVQGWNAIDFAHHHECGAPGLRIIRLLLLKIVNYPEDHQADLLSNLPEADYSNVFQLSLLYYPDMFAELSHIALHNDEWEAEVWRLIKFKDQLDKLKFDEHISYFKSEKQSITLATQLEQAKYQLFLYHISLGDFKLQCLTALQQSDEYFAIYPFPQPDFSLLSFIFPPEKFETRYKSFKETIDQFLNPDAAYIIIEPPEPSSYFDK